MAPIQPSLSALVFLTLALILLSITPAFSTSRHQPAKTGFQMTLTSVDSGGSFTHSERLQRAVKRSNNRLNQFNKMVSTANDTKLSSPVFPNGETEYLMNLSIGTPPISYSALMDTGSDLIWTQCKPCIHCFPQPTPVFDPKNSSSYSNVSCTDKLCEALPISSCNGGCEYLYTYGGGGFTAGFLATETFTFGNVSVPKVGFGCGESNGGDGLRLSAGLVGLGRGTLSLISQLNESEFSYCLTYWNGTKPSTLLIGSQPSVNSTSGGVGNKTTPLIQNPQLPTFYYVSLEGITIGSTKLPVNKTTFAIKGDGSGGVIVDSGTSITFLENSAYNLVRNEFISQVKLPVVKAPINQLGLDLCFKLPTNASSVEIPALGFNFTNVDLQFPTENYMITNSSAGVICLAMGGSVGFSIFGNMLQQNSLVVYDLFKETLSFMPMECEKF